MSVLNKIPFGLRESNKELVDVNDVPNGKQCGCICPSCHTPLEARQGRINVWHFGHASKGVYEKTKNKCEYSFYTSIRLMARQIIGKQIKLGLPEYKGKVPYYEGVRYLKEYKYFTVTEEKDITIDNIDVETTFSDAAVDIVGTIDKFQFVIYLSHPYRVIPESLYEPKITQCGIIEIALDSLELQFPKIKSKEKSFQEILTDFLMNNRTSKKWIYHPRYKKCEDLTTEQLRNTPNILLDDQSTHPSSHEYFNPPKPHRPPKFNSLPIIPQSRLVKFECIMCKTSWVALEAGGNICQKCNNYLYTKTIGVVHT
ncbi:MAG: hypothetical protein ISR72_01595 [Methylobacter sp.]|nr:hypothetical protein [Methylobacter sp.]